MLNRICVFSNKYFHFIPGKVYNKSNSPFSYTYYPNVPELLQQLNISLTGEVVFLSSPDGENMVQLLRNFEKARGVALHGNKMVIASKDELTDLANAPVLAKS